MYISFVKLLGESHIPKQISARVILDVIQKVLFAKIVCSVKQIVTSARLGLFTSCISILLAFGLSTKQTSTSVKGGYTFDTIVASTGAISRISGDVRLHAKTKAEQKFFVDIKRVIN